MSDESIDDRVDILHMFSSTVGSGEAVVFPYLTVILSVILKKGKKIFKMLGQDRGRLWQARYFAVMVMVMTVTYFLYPTRRRHDPKSTAVTFIHLATFAAHFGTQCWVTFVAGLTMFYNLPRIMFGQVQTRLFPMYFATTLALSAITLVTYCIKHPYDNWGTTECIQACLLTVCVLSTFVNTYFLAPVIVDLMTKCFEIEKEHGVAYVVGYVDRTELKKNPVYYKTYRGFRKYHGVSALANIATMVCNFAYLYYLSTQCTFLKNNL